mmetsp:Transcript_10013/g.17720  ORF Transcript_10013/g.17720 Transcript_10013/m.17720 type:complete len:220 (-) Transcript_10013:563-1222(-)
MVHKYFIGGLPSEASHDDLRREFGQYGEITEAFVMMRDGTSRRFGFVTFVQRPSEKLLSGEAQVLGKPVAVKRAVSQDDIDPASTVGGKKKKWMEKTVCRWASSRLLKRRPGESFLNIRTSSKRGYRHEQGDKCTPGVRFRHICPRGRRRERDASLPRGDQRQAGVREVGGAQERGGAAGAPRAQSRRSPSKRILPRAWSPSKRILRGIQLPAAQRVQR